MKLKSKVVLEAGRDRLLHNKKLIEKKFIAFQMRIGGGIRTLPKDIEK